MFHANQRLETDSNGRGSIGGDAACGTYGKWYQEGFNYIDTLTASIPDFSESDLEQMFSYSEECVINFQKYERRDAKKDLNSVLHLIKKYNLNIPKSENGNRC